MFEKKGLQVDNGKEGGLPSQLRELLCETGKVTLDSRANFEYLVTDEKLQERDGEVFELINLKCSS